MNDKPNITDSQKHKMRMRAAEKYLSYWDPDRNSIVNKFIAQTSADGEREDQDNPVPMFLSDQAKNRMIFYVCQDTGHALLNAISILRRLRTIEALLIILIALIIFLIWGDFDKPWNSLTEARNFRMSRFAFNATCSVVMIIVMSALGWRLKHVSIQFLKGVVTGSIGFLLMMVIIQKLDAESLLLD